MKGKLSKKTLAITGAGILIAIVAVAGIKNSVTKNARNEKNIYMALSYLQQRDYENAEEYLEQTAGNMAKKHGFVRDSAEIIRQYLIGNQVLLDIELDVLQMEYKLKDDWKAIEGYLAQMSEQSFAEEDYEKVVKKLIRMLDISDKKQAKYKQEFEIESNAFYSGYLTKEEYEGYAELYGEEAAANLQLGAELSSGNYGAALATVAERVKEKPSEENRLLLAEVIARAAYSSYGLDEETFYAVLGKEYDSEKREKEEAKFEKRKAELEEEIEEITFDLQVETEAKKVTELNERLKETYAEIEELSNRFYKGMVYKALNSIANISSLEAEVLEAKLYYALNQEEKAAEILLDATKTVKFAVSDNTVLKNGLEAFAKLDKGAEYSSKAMAAEVTDDLSKMLNYVNEDIRVKNQTYYYENTLAQDFSDALVAKYKYMNNDIYITSLDDSNYPEIKLTLNAREEILQNIVDKKDIVLRDTYHEVKYDAKLVEHILSTICFVVDVSGSMGGTPIEHAKEALSSFSKQLDADMQIALVEFESEARILTELSNNISEFIRASETLDASGGTEIAEGIRCGIEVLQNSNGIKNIILMTDGQSSLDNSVIEEAKRENVTIYTVGFGGVDSDMLTRIAEETGGSFTLADSSGDLLSVYESIGRMIGNSVELTYTVSKNPEESQRYAYIVSEAYDSARKREYGIAGETQEDGFGMDDAYVFSVSDMVRREQNQEKVTIYLPASERGIEEVEINQQAFKTMQEYGSPYIEMEPPTKEGLYDMTFVFSDGSASKVEDCILIYDETIQGDLTYTSGVRIGCLTITSNGIYQLSDGTVVLCGARFREAENAENALYAATENLVVLDYCTVSTRSYEDSWYYYDWGESGKFHMDGVIYLEYNDAQNQYNQRSVSAMGKLTGEIDANQCTIKTR